MSLVKGSKQYRVKVIEYRLSLLLLAIVITLALFCTTVAVAYFSGYKIGMSGQEKALSDVQRLTTAADEYRNKAERLEQELTNREMALEIDKQSNEGVRKEVIALKDDIAKLTEENSFYRGLMAPGDNANGLTIGSVELVSGRKVNHYNYKVIVQQLTQRHPVLKGKLRFTVFGRQDGLEKRYALMDLVDKVKSENIVLRFKYFQVIEGTLVLPESFEPEGIEIVAEKTGKKPKTVTKKFGWLVEER